MEEIFDQVCIKIICLLNEESVIGIKFQKDKMRILGKTRRDRWRNNRIRETLNQEPILNYIERKSIT
jgi:hypothetical protein